MTASPLSSSPFPATAVPHFSYFGNLYSPRAFIPILLQSHSSTKNPSNQVKKIVQELILRKLQRNKLPLNTGIMRELKSHMSLCIRDNFQWHLWTSLQTHPRRAAKLIKDADSYVAIYKSFYGKRVGEVIKNAMGGCVSYVRHATLQDIYSIYLPLHLFHPFIISGYHLSFGFHLL